MIFRGLVYTLKCGTIFMRYSEQSLSTARHIHRAGSIGRHRLPPFVSVDSPPYLIPARPHPFPFSFISKSWIAIKSTLMKFSQIKATMTLPLLCSTHLPNVHASPLLPPRTPPSQPPSSLPTPHNLAHPHSHPSKLPPRSARLPLRPPFAPSTPTAPTTITHVSMYNRPRENSLNLVVKLQARMRDIPVLGLPDVEEAPLCQHISQPQGRPLCRHRPQRLLLL